MTGEGSQPWARGTALAVGALTLCVGLLAACSSSPAEDKAADRITRMAQWNENATPTTVSKHMRVEIPGEATDRRAAHQYGLQDDRLLLSFVLPGSEVDAFIERLEPQEELWHRDRPLSSATSLNSFSHLGLEEPEALPNVRGAQVCAPCDGGLDFLRITVHPIGDAGSRVYLEGSD